MRPTICSRRLLMLVFSALLGACGNDSGPNSAAGSGATLPFSSEERCEPDPREIGCTTATAASRGTTFEDTLISLTYRGVLVVPSNIGPERSFGEPSTRPGVEYHLYFDLRVSEVAGPRWDSFPDGTNLEVEEASGERNLSECSSYPMLPSLDGSLKLEKGSTITVRWCLTDDRQPEASDAPSAFTLSGEAFHRATFAIDGQVADVDAASDVVASHDVVLKGNPGWKHDSTLAQSSSEASATGS